MWYSVTCWLVFTSGTVLRFLMVPIVSILIMVFLTIFSFPALVAVFTYGGVASLWLLSLIVLLLWEFSCSHVSEEVDVLISSLSFIRVTFKRFVSNFNSVNYLLIEFLMPFIIIIFWALSLTECLRVLVTVSRCIGISEVPGHFSAFFLLVSFV